MTQPVTYTVINAAAQLTGTTQTTTTLQAAYTAVALALNTGTVYVAAFYDSESQRSRNFVPALGAQSSQWSGATGTTYLYGSGTALSVVFPSVVSATLIVATDTNGVTSTGQLKLVLQPGSGDLFNASSVMTYYLDPGVTVIQASGGTF